MILFSTPTAIFPHSFSMSQVRDSSVLLKKKNELTTLFFSVPIFSKPVHTVQHLVMINSVSIVMQFTRIHFIIVKCVCWPLSHCLSFYWIYLMRQKNKLKLSLKRYLIRSQVFSLLLIHIKLIFLIRKSYIWERMFNKWVTNGTVVMLFSCGGYCWFSVTVFLSYEAKQFYFCMFTFEIELLMTF